MCFFVVGVEGVATGIALVDKILLRVLKVDMVRMQGYRGKVEEKRSLDGKQE